MKKTLIALAALASTAAFAQSSVELYGIVDQSYSRSSFEISEPGFAGKLTRTDSGNQSGLSTQRIGFRGTEDLGGGLKARFQIENSLSAGDAGTNGFGSRPTFVGIEGGFGTITLGRQDTVTLKAIGSQLAGGANNMVGSVVYSGYTGLVLGNPAAVDIATATGIVGLVANALDRNIQTTFNNVISYVSPNISGVTVEVQYGTADDKYTETGIAATEAKARTTGLGIRYASGPLSVNFGTHVGKTEATAGAVDEKRTNNYIGATYDFGVAKAFVNHATVKQKERGFVDYENKGTEVGVEVPFGAITAWAKIGTGSREQLNKALDWDETAYQLGLRYAMSKRTTLYTAYGSQKLELEVPAATGLEIKQSQFAVGVRHTF